jgi:3-phosphoshikimate 1-carboxyvinyltransferase
VIGKRLKGGEVSVDGSMSSQFVTALLLVAPYFQNGLTLQLVADQVSKPYIEMTLDLMRRAVAEVRWDGDDIKVKPKAYQPCEIMVEPDWSAASYFYGFKMLNPELGIALKGLKSQSIQGDYVIHALGKTMGIDTEFDLEGAILRKRDVMTLPRELNFIGCPDLAQTIAVMAAGAKWPLKLTGLRTLKVKETNRILALKNELNKCGVQCSISDDSLRLEKFEKPTSTPVISTYNDHRMAMAFAPLASVFGEIVIKNPEVVSKSFPDYWRQVEKLGFKLTRI